MLVWKFFGHIAIYGHHSHGVIMPWHSSAEAKKKEGKKKKKKKKQLNFKGSHPDSTVRVLAINCIPEIFHNLVKFRSIYVTVYTIQMIMEHGILAR